MSLLIRLSELQCSSLLSITCACLLFSSVVKNIVQKQDLGTFVTFYLFVCLSFVGFFFSSFFIDNETFLSLILHDEISY